MTPSKYQQAVYDFIKTGTGHGVVQAVAGSGKTTTIVNGLNYIEPKESVFFGAYNKHIAVELEKRVPSNVSVGTFHSVGWRICTGNLGFIKLNANKVDNIIRYETMAFDDQDKKGMKKYYSCRGALAKLVSLLRAHICLTVAEAKEKYQDLMDKHDIEYPIEASEFEQILLDTYQSTISKTKVMDFDDQLFMPIKMELPIPKFGRVIVDEAQDLNPIRIELVYRMGHLGRILCVGDTHQAIYGFTGADPEAMANITKRLNATTLPLSICYRCPKVIVAAAQKIVPQIEASESAVEGSINNMERDNFIKTVKDKEFVLCRTTAPLVSECLGLIRVGRKANVKGRDIGKNLTDLIDRIAANDNQEVDAFIINLESWYLKERERLTKRNKEDVLVNLEDKYQTLQVLSEQSIVVRDIKKRIEQIFSEGNSDGVTFMTAHRSKGLESDVIYILHPELMPHKNAKQEWQVQQEMNLKYVAITRSKRDLIWVNYV